MALFDFLKRKEEIEKTKEKTEKKTPITKKTVKTAKVSDVKETKKEEKVKPVVSKETKGTAYSIVKEPHISEKATVLAESNRYVFKVTDANKHDVKKAIEGVYGVNVLSVNMIKIPPKKRRLGKTEGFRKGYIKAVVRIKDGQKIEIF